MTEKTGLQRGDVLSVGAAANEVGVHYTTIYRWIEAGKIAFVRFGGFIFIPVTEVERVRNEKAAGVGKPAA